MVDVKVLRQFYGDERGVVAGQIIQVSKARAAQLMARGLVSEVKVEGQATLAEVQAATVLEDAKLGLDTTVSADTVQAASDKAEEQRAVKRVPIRPIKAD